MDDDHDRARAKLVERRGFVLDPLDEIFNRRNKIKQQKKRIENTQYDLDRWYDELRMKIIDAYTTAVEQLSILRSAPKPRSRPRHNTA